jgi:hypothetical protein
MARTLHHADPTVSDLALAKRCYQPMMEYLRYRMTESFTRRGPESRQFQYLAKKKRGHSERRL